MLKHNPGNERIKRTYFIYLKEAKRQSEQSVDAVAKALARFEEYTNFKSFKAFHHQQAIAFKKPLGQTKRPAIRRAVEQGDLAFHADRASTVLFLACRATRLQINVHVFRC